MAEVLYTPDGKPVSESNPLYVTSVGGSSGGDGKSVEFEWKGTELGLRQEGDPEYVYTDLKGATGAKGATGTDGAKGATGATGKTGVGISAIAYDTDTGELVFTMTEGAEQRVSFPMV